MQHYIARIDQGSVILSEADTHHLLNVKRAEIGEKIEISDEGKTYLCEVASLSPLKIDILEEREDDRELPGEVMLAFGLLKADHNEMIAQKGTELGVSSFLPFLSSRTIVKPQGKKDGKWARLEKIIHESTKQCRRAKIPELHEYSSFKEVLSTPCDLKYFAFEGEAIHGTPLGVRLEEDGPLRGQRILVLIGPEGGFSEEEATLAIKSGFRPVSLGKRILRAETAALYAASLLSDALEGGR